MFLILGIIISLPARAEVNLHVGIPLPPAIALPFPPALIVIPETNVYVAPDLREDMFFYKGWWWRSWDGRWYRSRNYNTGWSHYRNMPSFYSRIPSSWRDDYRGHRWKGHIWRYQHIPQHQVEDNWRGWERNKHWERHNYWGVDGLKSRLQSKEIPTYYGSEPQRSGHQFRDDHSSREIEQRRSQLQFPAEKSYRTHIR